MRDHGTTCAGWAFIFAVLMVGWNVSAGAQTAVDEQAYELSYSKGLIKFEDGDYAGAEALFRNALAAKPGDVDAIEQIGRSLNRQKKYVEAEQIFKDLLKKDPKRGGALLGLAIAHYHLSQYKEALTGLAAAEKAMQNDPLVYYYQGLAQNQIGAYNEAITRFARTMALSPELASEAHYQSGIAYYQQGILDESKAEFEAVVQSEPPESSIAQSAKAYLMKIAQIKPPKPKRWDLLITASQQYDTNVILAPLGTGPPGGETGISRLHDYVTAVYARGEYQMLQTKQWVVGASYSVYQNFHSKLSGFDVQDNTPAVFVQYQPTSNFQARMQYNFDYITVGRLPYLLANTFNPVFTIAETNWLFTQIQGRYQYQNFRPDRFAFNPTRNARNWLAGITQYMLFANNQGNFRLGYTYDINITGARETAEVAAGIPAASDWAYKGHKFSVGLGLPPMLTLKTDLAVDYYLQQYDNANSFSPTGTTFRQDNIYQFTGTVGKDLTKNFSLAFQYGYTRDQNNVSVFNYNRSVYSLVLSGHF